ncbi:MAG TPA: GFA family protein [Phenylobacterium sp.]
MSAPYEGGCLCGQVRWRATAEPANVRVCHCTLCQKATGGPFFARALFLEPGIAFTGETTRWASSARLDRLSCARCGTPMFAQGKNDPPRLAVSLATFDDPGAVAPDMHFFTSTKLPWLELADGLPQFPDRPPG